MEERMKKWALMLGALITGIFLGLAPFATALPLAAGLRADLTGDALTKCMYSELDDRLRANDMPLITPSPTPTPTPTPTPSEDPKTVVTAGEVTASSIEVKWTAV